MNIESTDRMFNALEQNNNFSEEFFCQNESVLVMVLLTTETF